MKKNSENRIDFIFAQVPLWITYSGLPQKLGMSGWCIYRRLLELRYRFASKKFFYALEKLCKTTGAIDKNGLKKILNKLAAENLIRYKTSQGRGMATEFEIMEPIPSPLSEEDVYHLHPRLRSHSYKKQLDAGEEKVVNDTLFRERGKVVNGTLLEKEKVVNDTLLEREKVVNGILLGGEKVVNDTPIKKDIYKKDNNNKNDLSHEGEPDHEKAAHSVENIVVSPVVVALDEKMLKEYGIAGEVAKTWLKKYSSAYLLEKIEILEYKLYNGEAIKNRGGMLKKAVEQDWQPPEGFSTRAERNEAARREREAREAEVREAALREGREKRERELALAAEEWKKTAPSEEREKIHKRALKEVMAENPGIEEKLLRVQVRLRENRIIGEELFGGKEKEWAEARQGGAP
ncbi:MAG: hypothetical protein RDU59_12730 [Thermodesulfobacteriota bacterium]|nr:hypothetical protein [Thermodesulfobacteriota bacterium]